MKRLVCTVLAFTMLFTITACGSTRGTQNSGEESEKHTVFSGGPGVETEEARETEAGAETGIQSEAGTEPETGTELKTKTENEIAQTVLENKEQEEAEMKMKIQIGETVFTATLAKNSSVDALKELMKDGPLTLNMSDYASMEKGADLGVTLPQNNVQMNTQAGDIILYQGRTFVIYYDTNSWSLTPIGKIDNVEPEELRKVLGAGSVTVTFSIE